MGWIDFGRTLLVEAFLLILIGWVDFGRTLLVEAFVLIFWCLRFELHFWDT
ncbi:hypothetical protein RHMOL_Rhmol01G0262200 [Rhododendron molle]|uniref:Uncharacterized protein n=1 Tax=Rhododendron molle TaxID=49168 RepID=A0ACC0Q642_RHOML|nr:hypothetical protein RHMOL_Rhmol01G0262200 [Rhododendron molle]